MSDAKRAADPTEEESREVAEQARETEWTNPSFVRELFLGRFRLDLIHPYPEQTPEDRRKTDAFLEKPADPPGLPDSPEESFASMGNYVFTTDALLEALLDLWRTRNTFVPAQPDVSTPQSALEALIWVCDVLIHERGFDPQFDLFEDWDFLIRLSGVGEFARVPRVTCEVRHFEGTVKVYLTRILK